MAKDFRFISWSLHDKGGVATAHEMLVRCDLLHAAHQDAKVVEFGSWGCVRLRADDPRLALLLAELRRLGVEPMARADREYSTKERESAAWLWLTRSTTMVVVEHTIQQWDRSHACPRCGCGSVALEPLVATFFRMPASGFAVCCPFGHVIAAQALVDRLRSAGLTGFTDVPCPRAEGHRRATAGSRSLPCGRGSIRERRSERTRSVRPVGVQAFLRLGKR